MTTEATIVALPPPDHHSDDGINDFSNHSGDDVDNEADEEDEEEDDINQVIRNDRLKEGKCPQCGEKLFQIVRRGVLRKKKMKPLTIEGVVVRGQCVKCIVTAGDEDLAVALAAMPEVLAPASLTQDDLATLAIAGCIATTVPCNPSISLNYDTTYKGEYNDFGERHGEGVLTWSNGDKYVGTFWNGVREGEGTLHFRDGSEYVGNWKDNKMHGEGTRRFPNGNVFNGTYREGRRSGHGRCYFSNGDMYVGEWKSDTMSGFGRYYYNNGESFEGFFLDGKRSGKGKYQLLDGRVDIYLYVNGVRVGDGVRWSANRKRTWRLKDGKVKGKVSLQVATQIMQQCQQGQPDVSTEIFEAHIQA